MARQEDAAFFRSREQEERERARKASDPASRSAHQRMAKLYRAKAEETADE